MKIFNALKELLKAITKEPILVVSLAALGVVGLALYVTLKVINLVS
jgi:hypothetical protein